MTGNRHCVMNDVARVVLIPILLSGVYCQNVLLDNDSPEFIESTEFQDMNERIQSLENKVELLTAEIKLLAETRVTTPRHSPTLTTGQHITEKRGFLFSHQPRAVPDTEVGFHVTQIRSITLERGQNIKFDKVVTLISNHYDKSTGVFTCHIPGTYMFSVTIVCDPKHYMEVTIMKNSESVFTALSDYREGVKNQGGGTTVLKLAVNDEVKVVMTWPGNGQTSTLQGKGLTSFNGYLLRSD